MRLNADMKSSDDDAMMSIGEIARRFGLPTHVLRHWESMGLLTPARVRADRRRYDRDHLYRVAVILRAKEAGFSLADIREMIATGDPEARRDILRRRHADLTRRVAQARSSLHMIECALSCDHEDFTGCAHFQRTLAEKIGV
ncbi:MerR family transcriptional regulator [Streptosporangium oxazolinicum]|uniref:MerR family transcriptional regulator n=2 Tax=Streptosporangium oxazolinicum TaxID=909287 RepID=A0ABP8ACH7_9ACTN